VLNLVQEPESARMEMEEIKKGVQEETGTWGELFAPGIRIALLVGWLSPSSIR